MAPGVSPKPSIVLKLVSPMAPGIRDEWNLGVSRFPTRKGIFGRFGLDGSSEPMATPQNGGGL